MIEVYTTFSILAIFVFIAIHTKLFLSCKYWPFLFYLIYACIFPIASNLYLEQGVYVTEQERISYFTGSTLRLIFYDSILFITCFISLYVVKESIVKKSITKERDMTNGYCFLIKPQRYTFLLFYVVIFIEILIFLNLFMSEIPLFSSSVTRFNYWENSRFPSLRILVGNISLPIAVILGIYFMLFSNNDLHIWKRRTLVLFIIYIAYLYLIGQKFSAQLLAVYLFFLPYWVSNFKKVSSFLFSMRFLKIFIPLVIIMFGFILYKYQFTGISEMSGSALSGIFYRIFGLQGHVYWGIDEMVFQQNSYGWHYVAEFVDKGLNGLLLEMELIGPSNLSWYLDNNIRFTAGYPAIAILFHPGFAVIIQMVFGILFSLLILYTYQMLIKSYVYRSFFALMILLQFQIGLSMGDFAFLYAIKFLIPLVGLFFTQTLVYLACPKKAD